MFGSGKNTRRFRRTDGLLHLGSRYTEASERPALIDPHGNPVPGPTAYPRTYPGREDADAGGGVRGGRCPMPGGTGARWCVRWGHSSRRTPNSTVS